MVVFYILSDWILQATWLSICIYFYRWTLGSVKNFLKVTYIRGGNRNHHSDCTWISSFQNAWKGILMLKGWEYPWARGSVKTQLTPGYKRAIGLFSLMHYSYSLGQCWVTGERGQGSCCPAEATGSRAPWEHGLPLCRSTCFQLTSAFQKLHPATGFFLDF